MIAKARRSTIYLAAAGLLMAAATANSAPTYVDPVKPAKERVKDAKFGPPPSSKGEVTVPVITWGADLVTIRANGNLATTPDSAFGKAGLNIKLVKQDDFVTQVRNYIEGKSPFLRGTMGMVNAYSEAFEGNPGAQPTVVMQLSWSAGGDCLVVRDAIKTPKDLSGKTIVLQQYGPHVEYLDQVLRDAGLTWADVKIKWCEELYDLNGKADDPAKIMREDSTVDAVFCISPDAAALTSNMAPNGGTGAEGSIKGAHVLLSTKTANRVIADVYAVRKDFYDANKSWVDKFVETHLAVQKQVADLVGKKGTPELAALLKLGADKLLDNPEDVANMEGMMGDCALAQEAGNAEFFGNASSLIGFAPTTKRNQAWLVTQGFLTKQQELLASNRWAGSNAVAAPKPQFKQDVAQKIAAEANESSVLFSFEIGFDPNQNVFDPSRYGEQFQRVLELSSTYGGAVLEVVGHSDPYQYLRMKIKDKADPATLKMQEQAGLNLSLQRAISVRNAVIAFAKGKNIPINESQFVTNGKGYLEPKTTTFKTEADLAKNRRVVFRLINIESESANVFEPLDASGK